MLRLCTGSYRSLVPILHLCTLCTDPLYRFSVYVQVPSTNSPFMYIFLVPILRLCTGPLYKFSVYVLVPCTNSAFMYMFLVPILCLCTGSLYQFAVYVQVPCSNSPFAWVHYMSRISAVGGLGYCQPHHLWQQICEVSAFPSLHYYYYREFKNGLVKRKNPSFKIPTWKNEDTPLKRNKFVHNQINPNKIKVYLIISMKFTKH